MLVRSTASIAVDSLSATTIAIIPGRSPLIRYVEGVTRAADAPFAITKLQRFIALGLHTFLSQANAWVEGPFCSNT